MIFLSKETVQRIKDSYYVAPKNGHSICPVCRRPIRDCPHTVAHIRSVVKMLKEQEEAVTRNDERIAEVSAQIELIKNYGRLIGRTVQEEHK